MPLPLSRPGPYLDFSHLSPDRHARQPHLKHRPAEHCRHCASSSVCDPRQESNQMRCGACWDSVHACEWLQKFAESAAAVEHLPHTIFDLHAIAAHGNRWWPNRSSHIKNLRQLCEQSPACHQALHHHQKTHKRHPHSHEPPHSQAFHQPVARVCHYKNSPHTSDQNQHRGGRRCPASLAWRDQHTFPKF